MSEDVHARFCESPRGQFLRATRPLCHCTNQGQAERLKVALTQRLADCGLEVHPQKTHIVYCKDSLGRGRYPEYQLDFLGFTFRPRKSKDRFGRYFTNFTPAVNSRAAKAIRQTMRRWAVSRRTDKALDDLARIFNPVLLLHLINFDGCYFVMPAQAGIQEHPARTCTYASWIPGLALLARNDVTVPCKIIEMDHYAAGSTTTAAITDRRCIRLFITLMSI